MTYLEMLNHYTCPLSKNGLVRVMSRWEKYLTVTQWGYSWTGGYLIEMTDGNWYHLHGWLENDAPWMNEAWVYVDKVDMFSSAPIPNVSGTWQDYFVEVER